MTAGDEIVDVKPHPACTCRGTGWEYADPTGAFPSAGWRCDCTYALLRPCRAVRDRYGVRQVVTPPR